MKAIEDIVARATMKSLKSLDEETLAEVSLFLLRPPAKEGLKRWWHLVEEP